jgi:cytoskeletal protein RodZ
MPDEFGQERNPRRRSNTPFAAIAILIVIIGGGYLAWKAISGASSQPEAPIQQPVEETPAVTDERASYASTTAGISLRYPQGYTVNEAYINTSVNPSKPISGVKFTVPTQVATGTNLSADSGVSVEWLPRANKCTGDIYLAANVRPIELADNGVSYSVATSSSAGAGNMYEEYVFAIASSSPCTAVRYFIHTTQLANYPEGSVREFNKAALLAEFDEIRRSLQLQ